MKKLFMLGFAVTALIFTSCNSDDDDFQPVDPEVEAFSNGVFVLNEGGFGSNNASVSFLAEDGTVTQQIFNLINGENLGDVAQSLYLKDDRAYIVLNGSGTVEVVNRYTFEKIGTVSSGLANPRNITVLNGKGFVTNWGDPTDPNDDFVAVVDLSNFSVTSTISVSEGPEQIHSSAGGKLYVAHMGGWGFGSSVSVVNPSTQTVDAEIATGDVPESIVVQDEKLFVLSSGKAAWTGDETGGSLAVYDLLTNHIISSVDFATNFHPENLKMNEGVLYFTENDKVFKANAGSLDVTELFSMSAQGVFGAYGFDVRDGKIFVGDAGDYTSDGTVYIYNMTGGVVDSFTAGLLPNGFGFND